MCVITTTSKDGSRYGLTATAVCSVSADPPTLLVCVNSSTTTCGEILAAERFVVNLLAEGDKAVAHAFASPIAPEERFASGRWDELETGAPALVTAVAAFDCRVAGVFEVATHRIILGDIRALQSREDDVKPLLYAQGGFGGFLSGELLAALKRPLGLSPRVTANDPEFLEDGLHWGLF